MKILSLDTSNQAMSVAVTVDGVLLAETTLNKKRTHSTQLLPTIDQLVRLSGLTPDDLDRIVVADGPGSYTGLRIGVTTGKTLASTLNRELAGISSLAVLAANVRDTTALIVPVMDARRRNVFSGIYQWQDGNLINVVLDKHVGLDQLAAEVSALGQDAVFVGTTTAMRETLRTALPDTAQFADDLSGLPRAARLAELGALATPVDVDQFVPRYLRLTEAEVNWQAAHPNAQKAQYVEKV